MEIQSIDSSQAALLTALAKNIYKEYYLHLWLPGGADWYMNEYAYAEEKLRAELADKTNRHYLVYENSEPVGYLKLRMEPVLAGLDSAHMMEIERIYLHRKAAGKGIGRKLMLFSEDIARSENKTQVFLKAMDSSTDAIGFYKHMGYAVCGAFTLPFSNMKEEYRGMVILQKQLGENANPPAS